MTLMARVFAALGAAAFVPAASAVASALAQMEYRGRALGTVVAAMTVAQIVGVPFGAFVRAGGYHGAMVGVALLVFGVASAGGSTLGGRLTDRFGALPVVVVGLVMLTLAM
jgi:DHA1 family inner membrane transport protein